MTNVCRNRLRWLVARLRCSRLLNSLLVAVLLGHLLTYSAYSQQNAEPSLESVQQLAQQQSQLAERYRKVEELLLRLADVEATENPERAAILRRAARQSRDKFILDKLQSAAGKLSTEEYQKALDDQKVAQEELGALLKLLMTEDRPQRIRDEKERVSNWIKDLKRIERGERSTRARTENNAALDEVLKEQKEITQRAEEIESDIRESDDSQPSDSQPSDSQPSDSQPSDSQPSDSQPSDSQPSDSQPSDSQPSDSQPSDSQPSDSQPSDSQPSDSQPSDSQPTPASEPSTPQQSAQKAVEKAKQKMKEAQQRLEEAQRDKAVEAQREAEQALREAIEELEQILRQLREEEMLRELARLESRLRQMAQMQTTVLEKTRQLDLIPVEDRDRQIDIRSGNLAFEQKKIVLEADRAILLLREEGSSVAFPEVVQQMRGDMIRVADRLSQSKIDAVTQGIQEDILAALEEMIAALQQAQRDLEKQQQQQQQAQQQGGQSSEQPLVEPLAELKLIRTMQTRIKATTERYGAMVPEQGGTIDEDLQGLLQNLAVRQSDLYRITRDLLLKRNK